MASNVEWWTCEFWETEAYIQAEHLLQEREPVKKSKYWKYCYQHDSSDIVLQAVHNGI